MSFKDRLKYATTRASRKQVDIARKLGVQKATVSRWFNGKTKNMKATHLLATAKFLGVSVNWLEYGEGKMVLSAKESLPQLSDDAILLSHQFMELNPNRKVLVREFLVALTSLENADITK